MQVLGVDWQLDVRYREKSFSGAVRIGLEDAPDPLELDAEGLAIDAATLDGTAVTPTHDSKRHTLSFAGVTGGRHVLEIRYRGKADPKGLTGMYVAPSGESYVLTTMLFPSGSRRLLPGFEHPAIKTVYRLTLTTDAEDRVVFNTTPTSSREIGERREWTFAPTPRMSAYLLYLGVGPFDRVVVDEGGPAVGVVTTRGQSEDGRFTARQAKEILTAYEEYYGIPYPLPKLDIVALENFWAGAMENWGAISGRADLVLVGSATSVTQRRLVTSTMSHEIAHQWFGNLVTNSWWDDFWLNESFATFVGYRILQHRFPADEPEKAMITRWVATGLEMDSLKSTHPIHVPVDSPDQLGEHADPVTYGKGAAVLRMIESYIGEPAFRLGVTNYLRRFQYSNARAEDLWAALGEASAKPVGPIMKEWVMRPGYPIIRVRWADGILHFRQEQYRQDGDHVPGAWPVPIRIRTAEHEETILFDRADMQLPVGSPRGLLLDPGRNAFARFELEGVLFDEAMEALPQLDPFDQWGIVSDVGALVFSGDMPFDRLLKLLERAALVTDELPVRAVLSLLGSVRLVGKGVPAVERAANSFLRRQFDHVGMEPRDGEADLVRVLREGLALTRARFDLEFARTLGQRFANYGTVPAELRAAVGVSFARSAGSSAFDEILAHLRSTTEAGERNRLVRALGALGDATAFRRGLDLAGSPDVPSSAVYDLLLTAGLNTDTGDVLFDWFRENASNLSRMWSGTPLMSGFLLARMSCLGLDREDEVRSYFADHTPADAAAGAALGLEDLAITMRLRRTLIHGTG